MELTGIDKVPAPVRGSVQDYANRVREYGGANALSLTLFGPAAGSAFNPARDMVASVVVLESIDLTCLRRLAADGARFGKHRIAAPLVMTPALIKASRDSFPLELIEVQQQHLVIFGSDLFQDLVFDEQHVRLECEREFKTIAIGMTRGLVADASDAALAAIALQALEELVRTLRGLLWLHGERAAAPAADMVSSVEALVSRPLLGVRECLLRPAAYGWAEFQLLYRDIEALGHFADVW
jgi:hypothetical protein